MSIQDISISNNQKKKLLRAITDENILFQDDTGELVLNVAAYNTYKEAENQAPIEAIVGEDALDARAEYVVFN